MNKIKNITPLCRKIQKFFSWDITLFILISLFINTATSAQQITVVKLQNRSAEEIIPIVQPLLSDKEGISGHGYELYINAKPATLQTIRELIARIDKQAAQLLISVKNLLTSTLFSLSH